MVAEIRRIANIGPENQRLGGSKKPAPDVECVCTTKACPACARLVHADLLATLAQVDKNVQPGSHIIDPWQTNETRVPGELARCLRALVLVGPIAFFT
jgi:hypothetical protein